MFGRPTRRTLGPRYNLWASLASLLVTAGLVWVALYWSASVLD
jgi:hypothetical protein